VVIYKEKGRKGEREKGRKGEREKGRKGEREKVGMEIESICIFL